MRSLAIFIYLLWGLSASDCAFAQAQQPSEQAAPVSVLTEQTSEGAIPESNGETKAYQPSVQRSAVKMIAGLFCVVFLILACAFFLKRFNLLQGGVLRQMKVVDVLSVGGREKIMLVEVYGHQLLIGVAPGHISKLHTFEEQVASVPLSNHRTQENASLSAKTTAEFSKKLNEFLSGKVRGE